MNKFDRYGSDSAYSLRLSNGDDLPLLVTGTNDDSIEGYPCEVVKGNDGTETLALGKFRHTVRKSDVVARAFLGGFNSFDAYEFDPDGPTFLYLKVPEDKRDGVDYEYHVVSCPADDPEVDAYDEGECDWEGDVEELCPGGKCPACGSKVPDPREE